jgi:hypothetical protein
VLSQNCSYKQRYKPVLSIKWQTCKYVWMNKETLLKAYNITLHMET